MSGPVKSSGSLSTDGMIGSTSAGGLLHYGEAVGGILTCYDGSTSGALLLTVPSSHQISLVNPVSYGSSGLHVQISAGTATVHFS